MAVPAIVVIESRPEPAPAVKAPLFREVVVKRGVDFVSYWLRVF